MTPAHFDRFALPPAAVRWLLDLWLVIQVMDDVADHDPVERQDLDAAIFAALAGMPMNPFFIANHALLAPSVAAMVLKWKASDVAERGGAADERSFMWRAGYYDVVLTAVLACHGPQAALNAAPDVMWLYGETFAEYRKEFPCPIL